VSVGEPGHPFEAIVTATGDLQPVDLARARLFLARAGQRLTLKEMDSGELRRDRQSRYWFKAVVGTVKQLWEKQCGHLIPKEAVHDRLVTIFGGGLVETPLGLARTSSSMKTVREFAQMTSDVIEYVWHEYGVQIPSSDEWRDEC